MKCCKCLREPRNGPDKMRWDVDDLCPECIQPVTVRLPQIMEEVIEANDEANVQMHRLQYYVEQLTPEERKIIGNLSDST